MLRKENSYLADHRSYVSPILIVKPLLSPNCHIPNYGSTTIFVILEPRFREILKKPLLYTHKKKTVSQHTQEMERFVFLGGGGGGSGFCDHHVHRKLS